MNTLQKYTKMDRRWRASRPKPSAPSKQRVSGTYGPRDHQRKWRLPSGAAVYNEQARGLALNVLQHMRFLENNSDVERQFMNLGPRRRAANTLGVSYKFMRELDMSGEVKPPQQPANRSNHASAFPVSEKDPVHDVMFEWSLAYIMDEHRGGRSIVRARMFDALVRDFSLQGVPGVSLNSFDRWRIHVAKFEFMKHADAKSPTPVDSLTTTRVRRREFIKLLINEKQRHRKKGRKPRRGDVVIAWIDESYYHVGGAPSRSMYPQQSFWQEALTLARKANGKGQRYCFAHCVTADGLVPGAFWIFEGKKEKVRFCNVFCFGRSLTPRYTFTGPREGRSVGEGEEKAEEACAAESRGRQWTLGLPYAVQREKLLLLLRE